MGRSATRQIWPWTRSGMVDKRKIATEGFVMLLDYNENRMVELGVDLDSGEDSTPFQKMATRWQ